MVTKISVFIVTYGIYSLFFFAAVFTPLTSLHSNAKSVSTPLRSSGPRFLTAGPFFTGRFTARYARGNYAANFYAHFLFFHVHTHSKTAYSATMLRITGREAGRKHKYRYLRKFEAPNTFPPFYGSDPTLFRQNGNFVCFLRDRHIRRLVAQIYCFKGSRFSLY